VCNYNRFCDVDCKKSIRDTDLLRQIGYKSNLCAGIKMYFIYRNAYLDSMIHYSPNHIVKDIEEPFNDNHNSAKSVNFRFKLFYH